MWQKLTILKWTFWPESYTYMGPKHTKRSEIANICGGMFSTFFGFTQYFGKHSGFEIFKITMGFTVIVKSQISAGARNLVCPMLDLVLHFWQVVGLSVVCGEERTEIFAEATMLSSQAHQELQDPAHLLNIFPGCGQSSLLCCSFLALFFFKLALPPS